MSKYTKITDPAQLNEALDSYENAWEKIPAPSQPAIEAVLASSENPKAKGAKWDQFIDDRFVKELVAAGMFKVGASPCACPCMAAAHRLIPNHTARPSCSLTSRKPLQHRG